MSAEERLAAVLADRTVFERLGQGALDELRDRLIAGLKSGTAADALCEAIAAAGERLAAALPRQTDDVNELPDALVMLGRV